MSRCCRGWGTVLHLVIIALMLMIREKYILFNYTAFMPRSTLKKASFTILKRSLREWRCLADHNVGFTALATASPQILSDALLTNVNAGDKKRPAMQRCKHSRQVTSCRFTPSRRSANCQKLIYPVSCSPEIIRQDVSSVRPWRDCILRVSGGSPGDRMVLKAERRKKGASVCTSATVQQPPRVIIGLG